MEANSKMHQRRVVIMIATISFLIIAFIISAYAVMNRMTLDMVITYTDELAKHDMATIDMFVTDRWATLKNVYNRTSASHFTTIDDIISSLHRESDTMEEFDRFYVYDTNGILYSDTGVRYTGPTNPLRGFFEQEENPFVERYYGTGTSVEEGEEYMLYGLKFPDAPIVTTDGSGNEVRIVGLAVMNNIKRIRSRIMITAFDGRGYASIIDKNGDYIVPDKTISESYDGDSVLNFYDILADEKIDGMTVEDIKKIMTSEQALPHFWCTSADGSRHYVSVYSIDGYSGWKFVIGLDESVFSEQTGKLIGVKLIVFSILLLIIAAAIFIYFRMHNSLKKMYSSVSSGVYNRQFYEDKVAHLHLSGLAIMDLDYLKVINDTHGHIAGDEALDTVAGAIVNFVGKKGLVCRYGGDEFIVAFNHNLSMQEFDIILENMRKMISDTVFEDFPGLKISTSIGGYYAEGIASELMPHADKLLYKAKEKRNAVATNTK